MDVLDDPTHQLKLVTAPITLPGAQNKNTTRTHQQVNSLTGKMPSQFDLNIVVAGAEAYNNTGSVYTDETANAQSAAANDMTLLPAVATANSAYYFGHAQKFDFLTLKYRYSWSRDRVDNSLGILERRLGGPCRCH